MRQVAKILITDPLDRMLILERSDTHPKYPWHLDFPGGIVENGESPVRGVIREVFEECGLVIPEEIIELVFCKPVGDQFERHLYRSAIEIPNPNITMSWEHSSYRWLCKDELLGLELPIGVDRYYMDVINFLKSE